MKSYLANLAARAHGLAEVVQPCPRALFEPASPGGDGAVPESDAPAVTARGVAREPSHNGQRWTERVVEVERLLAAGTPPASASLAAAVPPDPAAPVVVSVVSAPVEPPASGPSAAVLADPPPAAVPMPPVASQPIVHVRRAAPVPDFPPHAALAPGPVPAPTPAPSVTIRIERVDVRAVHAPTPIARTAAAARRATVRPSLGDYLASRQ